MFLILEYGGYVGLFDLQSAMGVCWKTMSGRGSQAWNSTA